MLEGKFRLDADDALVLQRFPHRGRGTEQALDEADVLHHVVAGYGDDAPVRALVYDGVAQARVVGKLVFVFAHDGVLFRAAAHHVGKRLRGFETVHFAKLRVDFVVAVNKLCGVADIHNGLRVCIIVFIIPRRGVFEKSFLKFSHRTDPLHFFV